MHRLRYLSRSAGKARGGKADLGSRSVDDQFVGDVMAGLTMLEMEHHGGAGTGAGSDLATGSHLLPAIRSWMLSQRNY